MKLNIEQLKSLIKNSHLDFRKENIKGDCPKCGQNEFGISLSENHRFGCYRLKSCGYKGNIFVLLKDLNRLEEFRENEGYQRGVELYLTKKIVETQTEESIEIETVSLPMGFRRIYDHDYLNSRGFTEQDYKDYKVGITNLDSKLSNYIIFVVEYEQRVVGYVARSLLTKTQIKSLNDLYKSQGIDKIILRYKNSITNFSNLVYGVEEITSETRVIVVVEGIFDKINVDRHLYTLFGDTNFIVCIATFKCKVSPQQRRLVTNRGKDLEWWMFYDSDALKSIIETGQFLVQEGEKVFVIENKNEEIDPGEMNLSQIEECFKAIVSYEEFYQKNIIRKKLK